MQRIINKINPTRRRLPVSLRTAKDEMAYAHAVKKGKSRPLIEENYLREWKYWALIENKFPYTAAFKVHHLLIPKREAREEDLTTKEWAELQRILNEVEKEYDSCMLNFSSKQSKKNHYHLHLLQYKDRRKELSY